MKKVFWLVMALIMMMVPFTAIGAGKVTITQESMMVTAQDTDNAFVYAEIKNTGDKPLSLDGGVIEVLDKDGNTLGNATYLGFHPSVLAPGEIGYMSELVYLTGVTGTSRAVDHTLTVTGKTENHWSTLKIESNGEISEEEFLNSVERYVNITIKNNTDQPILGPSYVYVLYDSDGNLLSVGYDALYDIILPPQQTIIVKKTLYTDFTDVWDAKGVKPARVVTIAYDEIYK